MKGFTDIEEELFYQMLRIRLFEERIIDLYPSDKIQSPVHLSVGQEAVAVGSCSLLKPSDLLFCTYRSHAFYLAKGGDMRRMMAELYGKVTGCCKGKGGSMHMAAPEVGLMGVSAVVASTISHAVGAALAAKILGKDHLIVTVFGDGAMDSGVYHESLNFAALHCLPVIFILENNGLAVHSRIHDRHSYQVLDHVRTYGIPAISISEGYDSVLINNRLSGIFEEVRKNRTPYFIEIKTFRYKEHVGTGEDYQAGYRSHQELEEWQVHDPLVTNAELVEKYTPGIIVEIDDAVRFAEESPVPSYKHLMEDVI